MRTWFLILFVAISSIAMAKKKEQFVYDISCAGNAMGYYVVEVSAYVSSKKEISDAIVKKCALHGVLYRGFSGNNGCHSQKPLLQNCDESHSSLIDELITSECGKYVETIGVPLKVIKQPERYKVTTIIQVAKDLLRKDLEKAGIIRKLGF